MISIGHIKIKPGYSLLSFSSLRTLYMESVNFDELGESLYQLKHLRYLSMENSETSVLPENIGKLKFLQYIRLLGCKSLVKLPSSIGMLQHLWHLDIRRTSINTIPKGFCGSTGLTNLHGFPAHMICDRCSLEELGPLSQLMNVSIHFLENVASASFAKQARLGEKNRLKYLCMICTSRPQNDEMLVNVEGGISEEEQRRIEEVFDELCPPPCLENIDIKGYFGEQLPRWMMPASAVTPLWSLRILMMDDLPCCTELPSGLSQLPCLEHLQIRRAPVIKRVGLEFLQPNNQVGVVFPRLQKLTFGEMVEWEEWEWEEQVKAMPILETLGLDRCKLRRVPPGLASHARALKELLVRHVKNLSFLENFTSVVHLYVSGNTDLERISNLPKLQKLVIFWRACLHYRDSIWRIMSWKQSPGICRM
jgi:Leucine-rich repeat (LRR) protein